MPNIVYVLTNPAMQGIVKIGKTNNDDPKVRMNQLYTVGVPLPFECSIAVDVGNEQAAADLEKALHIAFGRDRLNRRREFFEIDSGRVEAILRIWPGSTDVTPQVAKDTENVDPADIEAAKKFKQRRPNLNFSEMGIPMESTLISVTTGEEATVVGDRRVRFKGEEYFLTAATRVVLGKDPAQAVRPTPYWTFNGRNLGEIYEETYGWPET